MMLDLADRQLSPSLESAVVLGELLLPLTCPSTSSGASAGAAHSERSLVSVRDRAWLVSYQAESRFDTMPVIQRNRRQTIQLSFGSLADPLLATAFGYWHRYHRHHHHRPPLHPRTPRDRKTAFVLCLLCVCC